MLSEARKLGNLQRCQTFPKYVSDGYFSISSVVNHMRVIQDKHIVNAINFGFDFFETAMFSMVAACERRRETGG